MCYCKGWLNVVHSYIYQSNHRGKYKCYVYLLSFRFFATSWWAVRRGFMAKSWSLQVRGAGCSFWFTWAYHNSRVTYNAGLSTTRNWKLNIKIELSYSQNGARKPNWVYMYVNFRKWSSRRTCISNIFRLAHHGYWFFKKILKFNNRPYTNMILECWENKM